MAIQTRLAWLRRKWTGARKYSAGEKLLVPVALVLLGISRAAILGLPFRRHAAMLGSTAPQGIAAPAISAEQDQRARSIGRAVRASATVTPWQSICLPQAMAASTLLRLGGVPHVVHFGLGKSRPQDAPMEAHAWIVAGDRIVTGGPVSPDHRIVASFVTPPRQ